MQIKIDERYVELMPFQQEDNKGILQYVVGSWAIPGGFVARTEQILAWADAEGVEVRI